MFYLGYDSGCSSCTGIARVVENETHGSITVVPLVDPRMKKWRTELLGEDPRWAPTLVRVDDENGTPQKAWVGSAIGHALLKNNGLKVSFKVLASIGELTRKGGYREGSIRSRMSRNTFLKGALATSAGILAIASPQASAAAPRETGESDHWLAKLSIIESNEIEDPKRLHNLMVSALKMPTLRPNNVNKAAGLLRDQVGGTKGGGDFVTRDLARLVGMGSGSSKPDFLQAVEHKTDAGPLTATTIIAGDLVVVMYSLEGPTPQKEISVLTENPANPEGISLLGRGNSVKESLSLSDGFQVMMAPGCNSTDCSRRGACYTCRCAEYNKTCVFNACAQCGLSCNRWAPWQLCLACVGLWCPVAIGVNGCCNRTHCTWRESCS